MIFRKVIPTVLVILMSWLNGGYAISSALAIDNSSTETMVDKIETKYQSLPNDKKIKFIKKQIKRAKKLDQTITKKPDSFFKKLNEEVKTSEKEPAKDLVKQAIEIDGTEKISPEETIVFSDIQADLEKIKTNPVVKNSLNKKTISHLIQRTIVELEDELTKLQGEPSRSLASSKAHIAGIIVLGVAVAMMTAGVLFVLIPLIPVGILGIFVGIFLLASPSDDEMM